MIPALRGCSKCTLEPQNYNFESDLRRIRVRTFSFSMIANFLGQLATSSLHHRIRLRILHKYSWSDFLGDPPDSLGASSKSVTPLSELFLSNHLHLSRNEAFLLLLMDFKCERNDIFRYNVLVSSVDLSEK